MPAKKWVSWGFVGMGAVVASCSMPPTMNMCRQNFTGAALENCLQANKRNRATLDGLPADTYIQNPGADPMQNLNALRARDAHQSTSVPDAMPGGASYGLQRPAGMCARVGYRNFCDHGR